MNMFNLTMAQIKRMAPHLIFKRGFQYYLDSRVKDLIYDNESGIVYGFVRGSRTYDTSIRFEKNGAIKHVCDCPYEGLCKHAIAMLLEILDRDTEGYFGGAPHEVSEVPREDDRTVINPIFSVFDSGTETMRTRVKVQMTLEVSPSVSFNNPTRNRLSFRIGTDRLYIVKNIRGFIEDIWQTKPMEFGLNFHYDPYKHDFASEDSKVFRLLHELAGTEEYMNNNWVHYKNNRVFSGKSVYLPQNILKDILKICKGQNLKVIINEDDYYVDLKDENLPMDFRLNKWASDLIMDVRIQDGWVPLDEDMQYVCTYNGIYCSTADHRRKIRPFIHSILTMGKSQMVFKDREKERFVSEILPYIGDIGNLEIDEAVSSSIIKLPLQSELYLDMHGDMYTANLMFVYGERSINPFSAAKDETDESGTILLRDTKTENEIINLLAETDFRVRNDVLYIDDDEGLFDFLTGSIHKLQELATVYYSDAFKKVKIQNRISLKGAVSLTGGNNLLEFSFELEGMDREELRQILDALKEKKRYHRLKEGGFLNLESDNVIKLADFIDSLNLDAKDLADGTVELPGYRAVYLDMNIRDAGHIKVERDHRFKELVQNITEPEDMQFGLPSGLDDILREYQKFGFKWLKTLAHYGMGGILADDMGLGKTIQVLSFILSQKNPGSDPSLIVVPTSLLYNWMAEIKKFVPGLQSLIISGNKDEREEKIKTIPDYDVIITSYPLIRRDIDSYSRIVFDTCIIDEAQHIKNHRSQNAKAVKSIRARARFALTGTPMENNLSELWSIFDFVMPRYLFSHSKFSRNYEKPIMKDQDHNAMQDLSKHINPFILRRIKNDVLLELPDKIESKMVSEMTENQKKIYLAWLSRIKGEVMGEIDSVGFAKSHIKILAGLTRLRQICCHPSLFLEDYKDESGKLLMLEEVIYDAMDGGHRVLVFSQFTSMLKIIAKSLKKAEISYMYLDGAVKAGERMKMVESFNEGEGDVFLISLKAGGTGLNLTGADTVIHYDPWWNPAVEEQATDRAHRIGQDKVVQVIRLIAAGTIEEKIYNLQQKKKALIESVIKPGETLLTKLTKEDVENLFSV